MITLAASEVKRRGIVAAEELLEQGPVHIVKNNAFSCVVLSEAQYQRLKSITKKRKPAGIEMLLNKPATGDLTEKQVKDRLKNERSSWEE